jgi:hypothetical protein
MPFAQESANRFPSASFVTAVSPRRWRAAAIAACLVAGCSSSSDTTSEVTGGAAGNGGAAGSGAASGSGGASTGGASGQGGVTLQGGSSGNGGTSATGGSAGTAGTGGTGGTATGGTGGAATGGTGGTATGGTAGTAGTGAAAGTGGSGGKGGTTDAGPDTSAGSGGTSGSGGTGGSPPGDGAVGTGCQGIQGHPTQPCTSIPKYAGVELALVEDFDSPLNLDTDPIWTYSDGFSDQAQVRFIKDAITFSGGMARLTMAHPAGGAPTGSTYAECNNGANGYPAPWTFACPETSGELRTKYNNYKYGYYEFRIKPPTNTNGNFIAAAFTFRTPKWQDWRELDIELQAASKAQTVPTNVIVGDNQGGWSAAISDAKDIAVSFNTQADFHTYGFDWEPTVVNFYIDRATNPTPVRVYATGSKLPIPNKSAKIMMNFWLFPSPALGGGDPANNVYPMVMQIDYVHFYKSTQETFYPCSPVPTCLPNEDRDYSKNNPTDGIPTTTSGL